MAFSSSSIPRQCTGPFFMGSKLPTSAATPLGYALRSCVGPLVASAYLGFSAFDIVAANGSRIMGRAALPCVSSPSYAAGTHAWWMMTKIGFFVSSWWRPWNTWCLAALLSLVMKLQFIRLWRGPHSMRTKAPALMVIPLGHTRLISVLMALSIMALTSSGVIRGSAMLPCANSPS